jgi:hypothetical protein
MKTMSRLVRPLPATVVAGASLAAYAAAEALRLIVGA